MGYYTVTSAARQVNLSDFLQKFTMLFGQNLLCYSASVQRSPSAINWSKPRGDSSCGGMGISGRIRLTAACLNSGSSFIFLRTPRLIFALYVGVKVRTLPQARQQYLPCLANGLVHVGQILVGYFRWRFSGIGLWKDEGIKNKSYLADPR